MAADSKVIRQLGQMLVDRNIVSAGELDKALSASERTGIHPVKTLFEDTNTDPNAVLGVVAERLDMEYYDPAAGPAPEPAALGRLARSEAIANIAMPVRLEHPDRLFVAMPDPLNAEKISHLEKLSSSKVVPMLGQRDVLAAALPDVYVSAASAAAAGVGTDAEGNAKAAEAGYHINELLELLLDIGDPLLALLSRVAEDLDSTAQI